MAFSEYTNKNIEEVANIFETSVFGFSKKEASLAQKKYGPNEIKVEDKEYLIAREEDILAIIE